MDNNKDIQECIVPTSVDNCKGCRTEMILHPKDVYRRVSCLRCHQLHSVHVRAVDGKMTLYLRKEGDHS